MNRSVESEEVRSYWIGEVFRRVLEWLVGG